MPFPQLPAVEFWNIDLDDPTSQLIDLIQPVQSFYTNAARGVEVTTSEEFVLKFLPLESSFGNTALSDVYCPWLGVNFFERAEIHKCLNPTDSCQRYLQSPIKLRETVIMDSPNTLYFPRGKKRGRYHTSSRDRSFSTDSLQAGTSNS